MLFSLKVAICSRKNNSQFTAIKPEACKNSTHKLRPARLFLLLLPAFFRLANAFRNHPIQMALDAQQGFVIFLRRAVGKLIEVKLFRWSPLAAYCRQFAAAILIYPTVTAEELVPQQDRPGKSQVVENFQSQIFVKFYKLGGNVRKAFL